MADEALLYRVRPPRALTLTLTLTLTLALALTLTLTPPLPVPLTLTRCVRRLLALLPADSAHFSLTLAQQAPRGTTELLVLALRELVGLGYATLTPTPTPSPSLSPGGPRLRQRDLSHRGAAACGYPCARAHRRALWRR
jgi:hypothetical protein